MNRTQRLQLASTFGLIVTCLLIVVGLIALSRDSSPTNDSEAQTHSVEAERTHQVPANPQPTPSVTRAKELDPDRFSPPPVSADQALVFGRVFLPDGETPAPGASVRMVQPGRPGVDAVADDSGWFALLTDSEDDALLIATRDLLRAPASRRNEWFHPRLGKQHGPVNLVLAEGALLTVAVVDAQTMAPVSRARVILDQGDERTTDREGLAEFDALPPGEWQVLVMAKNYAAEIKAGSVSSGAGLWMVVELDPGCAVYGQVTNENEEPVAGATLSFMQSKNSILLDATRAITDYEGYYRLESFPRGQRNQIMAFAPGYSLYSEPEMLLVEESEYRLDITLKRGPALVGRVIAMDKTPIAGALVVAAPRWQTRQEATTDSEGRFRFDSIGTSNPWLTVIAEGYAGASRNLDSIRGENPIKVEIMLEPGNWVGGRVIDPEGNPIPSVAVSANSISGFIGILNVRTDSNGQFVLRNLPKDVGFWFEPSDERFASNSRVFLELNQDDNEVTLSYSGAIRGRVLDNSTGDPMTRFSVRLAQGSRDGNYTQPYARLDEYNMNQGTQFESPDGTFELLGLTADASYRVIITSESCSPTLFDLQIARPSDEAIREEFAVSCDKLDFAGVVVDDAGKPIPGADVIMFSPSYGFSIDSEQLSLEQIVRSYINSNAEVMKDAVTNARGEFYFDGLPSGMPLYLLVQARGMRGQFLEDMQLYAPEDRESLRIQLAPAGVIYGKVMDERWSEHAQVYVYSLQVSGGWLQNGVSEGADFRFEGLAAGDYLVYSGKWTNQDSFCAHREVHLEPGDEVEVRLAEDSLAEVRGRILFGDRPMASGAVALKPIIGGIWINAIRITDEEGRFQFEDVEPGPYEVIAVGGTPSGYGSPSDSDEREIIEVGSADIDRDFAFGGVGSFFGRFTGLPKGGPRVSVLRVDSPDSGKSMDEVQVEGDGSFRIGQVYPGSYKMFLMQDTGGANATPIGPTMVMPDPPEDIDIGEIPYGAGGSIVAKASDHSMQSELTVCLAFENAGPVGESATLTSLSGMGNFDGMAEAQIRNLPSGSYWLLAAGKGVRGRSMSPVTVEEGEEARVTLETQQIVECSFRPGRNNPAEVVRLEVSQVGSEVAIPVHWGTEFELVSETLVPPEGGIVLARRNGFQILGVPPGQYRIEAWGEEEAYWVGTVELVPGETVNERFEWETPESGGDDPVEE
ncbi:carboxypeptidase-like regulatory domain-containing protein [bacterium]|nr:carboxypeptidase-like regulatory domain-containing protein [bacterium]